MNKREKEAMHAGNVVTRYFVEIKYNDEWITTHYLSLERAKNLVSYLHSRDVIAREVIAKTSYNFL